MRRHSRFLAALALPLLGASAITACGGGDVEGLSVGVAGSGGAAGTSAVAGKAGTAGKSGGSGAAGKSGGGGSSGKTGGGGAAGQAAGSAGTAGKSGGGGSAGNGSGGTATAGQGGTTVAGQSGSAGSAGKSGSGGIAGSAGQAAGGSGTAGNGGSGDAGQAGASGSNNGGEAGSGGAGGAACTGVEKTCGGACVLQNDPAFGCAETGCDPCAIDGANAACTNGNCTIGSCKAGFGDCDAGVAGCETNTATSVDHCGACGAACSFPHAAATCAEGACKLGACAKGYDDCNGDPSDGCEVFTDGEVDHCGACTTVCPTVAGKTPTCALGVCGQSSCAAPTADCDNNASNGCEVDLSKDAANCNACGLACSFPNGGATCGDGKCALGACAASFGNCDGNATNGCETDTRISKNNCGACGTVCGSANGGATCLGGTCGLTCDTGFGDCDAVNGNGCEVELTTDSANCGACGNACALDNAASACVLSQCAVTTCTAGFANIDNAAGNGCEYKCPIFPTTAETCNGFDDDCDGIVDEDNPGGGASCVTGKPGVCGAGTSVCSGGALGCVQNVQPSAETCDGKDNDCDGAVDNGNPGGGQSCNTGKLGACAVGTSACTNGAPACNQTVQPGPELPNGADDDCDGVADNGPTSCAALKLAFPSAVTGSYVMDTDGAGPKLPFTARCDMTTDGGGYTMVRFDDGSLGGNQDTYAALCATYGLEVVVPRTKAHAQSIYTWNGNTVPNLYNVFPKYNGATGIFNWTGVCKGQPCTFWMTDTGNGDVGCTNFEPNGDNNTAYRIYLRQQGCGIEGNWNDANNAVGVTGHVICSTNDK